MIQTEPTWEANEPQHDGLTWLPLSVCHRLPTVVVEIPQALQGAHHGDAGLILVLVHLRCCWVTHPQHQDQGSQYGENETPHDALRLIRGLTVGKSATNQAR